MEQAGDNDNVFRAFRGIDVTRNMQWKVGLLLALVLASAIAFAGYVLVRHGLFEKYFYVRLHVHTADNMDVGMPVVFSGLRIGNVDAMNLLPQGNVEVVLKLPARYLRWIRSDSVFYLDKPLIGAASIRVLPGEPSAPPLPADAIRQLADDGGATSTRVMLLKLHAILDNVQMMTTEGSPLRNGVQDLSVVSKRMAGEYGVLQGLTGNEARARELTEALTGLKKTSANLQALTARLDAMTSKADDKIFRPDGMADQTEKLLQETRTALKHLDATLRNAENASTDLSLLRGQIEASLHKTNQMLDELNRRWPFAKSPTPELP